MNKLAKWIFTYLVAFSPLFSFGEGLRPVTNISERFLPSDEDIWGPASSPSFLRANILKLYPRYASIRYDEEKLILNGEDIFSTDRPHPEEEFNDLRDLIFEGRENIDSLIEESFTYKGYLKSWSMQKIAPAYLKRVLDLKAKNFDIDHSTINQIADLVENKILSLMRVNDDYFDARKRFIQLKNKGLFQKSKIRVSLTQKDRDFLLISEDSQRNLPDVMTLDLTCKEKNCWDLIDKKSAQKLFMSEWNLFLQRMEETQLIKDSYDEGIIEMPEFDENIHHENLYENLVDLIKRNILNMNISENASDKLKNYLSKEENIQHLSEIISYKIYYYEYLHYRDVMMKNVLRIFTQGARQFAFIDAVSKQNQKNPFYMNMTRDGDRDFLYQEILKKENSPFVEMNYIASGLNLTFPDEQTKKDFWSEFYKRKITENVEENLLTLISEVRFSKVKLEKSEVKKLGDQISEEIGKENMKLIFNPIYLLMNKFIVAEYEKNNLRDFIVLSVDEAESYQWPKESEEVKKAIDEAIKTGKTNVLYIDAIKSLMNEFPPQMQIDFCVHTAWPCLKEELRNSIIKNLVKVKKRSEGTEPHYLDEFNSELLMRSF